MANKSPTKSQVDERSYILAGQKENQQVNIKQISTTENLVLKIAVKL
jgi:hypothetical protein